MPHVLERDPLAEITEKFKNSRLLFVTGEAGCEKTTTVPWHLAKDPSDKNVACCLPRRLQARSAAVYVQQNARDRPPNDAVGYTAGGEDSNPGSQLTYFTHGCFLRQDWETVGDRFAVVIVDEAHEQDMETQLLFWLLRRSLQESKELKVVIMSATMDVTVFRKYFAAPMSRPVMVDDVVEIGTRRHEVKEIFLEDIDRMPPGSNQRFRALCANVRKHMGTGQVPDWTKGRCFRC